MGNVYNRRGQIAQGMTFFVVLIMIFVLMGIFVLGSFLASKAKGSVTPEVSSVSTPGDFLLLKEIEVEDNNGNLREMSVLDALVEVERGKILSPKFFNALDSLVDEINDCLIFEANRNVRGLSRYYGTAKFDNGEVKRMPAGEVVGYRDMVVKIDSIYIGERKMDISFYYGRCLDE